MLVHLSNSSPGVDMSLHSDTLFWFRANQLLCLGEAANTNCIVIGFNRPVILPTIYHTRADHANHYNIYVGIVSDM